jgi:hypothetical protein
VGEMLCRICGEERWGVGGMLVVVDSEVMSYFGAVTVQLHYKSTEHPHNISSFSK